jgi:uncharacterized protein
MGVILRRWSARLAIMPTHPEIIARELSLRPQQVERALALFADGATLPFIARYRKEATGDLDEVQLGRIEERGRYLRELDDRRTAIEKEIAAQGKLDDALRARLAAASTKAELEDLYLPYKPKRRTRATMARERGLGPLAEQILAQAAGGASAEAAAAPFVGPRRRAAPDGAEEGSVDPALEVPDVEAALAGARDIVAEQLSERAELRARLRQLAEAQGTLVSKLTRGKEQEAQKWRDYFDWREPIARVPSHRALAVRRGEHEGMLRVALEVDEAQAIGLVTESAQPRAGAPMAAQLRLAIEDAWRRLLSAAVEVDVRLALKERADREAIEVFAANLRNLLLAPPLGGKRVLAIDPGFRTGCKVVTLSSEGALLDHTVVFPTQSEHRIAEAEQVVAALCEKHKPEAIAVGNGTGSRETEAFLRKLEADGRLGGAPIVVVSEAGASVYSASEIARQELPDEDVTVRGAVSIGRRLQDPLAELVKIDPKSIGVGQYQHDVHQPTLQRALDQVVESCVSGVGVDVNTASPRLLAYVAGLGEALAEGIVKHRAANGRFRSRAQLKEVPRLGARAFEQCAGFLRVRGGEDPLDDSAVHPESYDLVARIAADQGCEVRALIGHKERVRAIPLERFCDERRGLPTLRDIAAELEKPGRDPRASFEAVRFDPSITAIEHLQPGMTLPAVVTNVTKFGAFCDVGVHQDGLVHVSELAHRFVKDPGEVVKVGDRVRVRVLEVDLPRRRIALSIKRTAEPPAAAPRPDLRGKGPPPLGKGPAGPAKAPPRPAPPPRRPEPFNNPFAKLRK